MKIITNTRVRFKQPGLWLFAGWLCVGTAFLPPVYGMDSTDPAGLEKFQAFRASLTDARQAASAGRLEEAEQAVDITLQLMRDGAMEYGRAQWTPVWRQLRQEIADKEAFRRQLEAALPYLVDSMPMGDLQAVRGEIARARGEHVKFAALHGIAIRAMERTYRMLKLARDVAPEAVEPYANEVARRAQTQYQEILMMAKDVSQPLQTRIFAARQVQKVAELTSFMPVDPAADLQALHDQESNSEFQRYLKYLLRVSTRNNREVVQTVR